MASYIGLHFHFQKSTTYFFQRTLMGVLPMLSGPCQRTLKAEGRPGGGESGGGRTLLYLPSTVRLSANPDTRAPVATCTLHTHLGAYVLLQPLRSCPRTTYSTRAYHTPVCVLLSICATRLLRATPACLAASSR